MSLYVKDLQIWSLSLACALNNDSVPTHMLCSTTYRYTAFVMIPHSSMFSCLMPKMLWNPCWRHFLKKKRNDPSFTEDRSLYCLHSIWIWKCEWVPASSWRPACMGMVRAWGRAHPRHEDVWATWNRSMRVPRAFATLQYKNRVDKIMNDRLRCAMLCQRHTPCSHKAISWQVVVV